MKGDSINLDLRSKAKLMFDIFQRLLNTLAIRYIYIYIDWLREMP